MERVPVLQKRTLRHDWIRSRVPAEEVAELGGEEMATHTEHCRLCLVPSVLLRLGPHTKFLFLMSAVWRTVLTVIKPWSFQYIQGFAVNLLVKEVL